MKKILETLGILSFFIGIFLIIIQPFTGLTGAVIDISTTFSKINFIIGFAFIIVGIVLLILGNKK